MRIIVAFSLFVAAVGFLAGISFAVIIFINVSAAGGFVGWLDHWQTLVGGFCAIIAGAGSIAAVVWQSRESTRGVEAQLVANETTKKELLARKRIATCALMPAVLDEISEYVAQCAVLIKGVYHEMKESVPTRTRIKEPELPRHVLADMKELIENLDVDEAHVVADMLSAYQVNSARLKAFTAKYNAPCPPISLRDVENLYYKCIEIRLRADSMFPFARREINILLAPKFDEKSVRGALRLMDVATAMSEGFKDQLLTTLTKTG